MSRVFVLTEQDSLGRVKDSAIARHDPIAAGFWLSEDSAQGMAGLGSKRNLLLAETVKEYPIYVEKAYSLAHPVAACSPSYRGIQPLLAWEESLADSFLKYLIVGDFHQGLQDRFGPGNEVVFFSPSETQQAFFLFNEVRGRPSRVTVLPQRGTAERGQSLLGRLREFRKVLREARQGGEWKAVFWQPMEVLDDRYRIRSSVWPKARFAQGGRWFYGSYINYTRALRRHRRNLNGQVNWVVNQGAASRGVEQKDPWHYLWQFGRPSSSKDHEPFLREMVNYLQGLAVRRDDFPVRDFFRSSTNVSYLVTRILPSALAEIDLMGAFLDVASPEEVWVANQWGSEGELMMLAKTRGIPVTQVQHGALHRYFAVSPILSDRFLVWGSFWRNVLRAGKTGNVEIVSPDVDVVPLDRDVTKKAVKKRVTFLTTPLHLGLFWNPEATLREIAELVKRLEGRGHSVLMRIHPSDRVELWERSLRTTLGSLPSSLRFSKDDPLESVLRETDVALMFFSTVFLDCLAIGIPVIGLGWYPHIWQKPLGEMGAVRFADSIQEAVELVETLEEAPRQKHLAREFLAAAPY